MSEMEMTTEAEVQDFTDDLSDEALDRAEGAYGCGTGNCGNCPLRLLRPPASCGGKAGSSSSAFS